MKRKLFPSKAVGFILLIGLVHGLVYVFLMPPGSITTSQLIFNTPGFWQTGGRFPGQVIMTRECAWMWLNP